MCPGTVNDPVINSQTEDFENEADHNKFITSEWLYFQY